MVWLLISFVLTLVLFACLGLLFDPWKRWDFKPVGEDEAASVPEPRLWPDVTVIVPARNEAEMLPITLPKLLAQNYPGLLRLLVINDHSTDGTGDYVRELQGKAAVSGREVHLLDGATLPEGWAGKVWAMHQGMQRIKERGWSGFVWLTDADIGHEPESLRRLVAGSLAGRWGLNSRMARLRCENFWEKLLIPAFVYFFNMLYPMRQANDPKEKLAAAAGGCVLLSEEAVRKLDYGLTAISGCLIDDVNLARAVKSRGFPIHLALSRSDVVSLRPYESLDEIWSMIRRSAFTQLNYSPWLLLGTVVALGAAFVVPVMAILAAVIALLTCGITKLAVVALVKGFAVILLMAWLYRPAVVFFGLNPNWAFLFSWAGLLYGLMTVDSARVFWLRRDVGWRGARKK
jgi:hopene-associated glycosyltransferase HpnB